MKKTRFKNLDVTLKREYRVICLERDHTGKWTTEYRKALDELVQHQREHHQTHDVRVEERVTMISSYDANQFQLLQG